MNPFLDSSLRGAFLKSAVQVVRRKPTYEEITPLEIRAICSRVGMPGYDRLLSMFPGGQSRLGNVIQAVSDAAGIHSAEKSIPAVTKDVPKVRKPSLRSVQVDLNVGSTDRVREHELRRAMFVQTGVDLLDQQLLKLPITTGQIQRLSADELHASLETIDAYFADGVEGGLFNYVVRVEDQYEERQGRIKARRLQFEQELEELILREATPKPIPEEPNTPARSVRSHGQVWTPELVIEAALQLIEDGEDPSFSTRQLFRLSAERKLPSYNSLRALFDADGMKGLGGFHRAIEKARSSQTMQLVETIARRTTEEVVDQDHVAFATTGSNKPTRKKSKEDRQEELLAHAIDLLVQGRLVYPVTMNQIAELAALGEHSSYDLVKVAFAISGAGPMSNYNRMLNDRVHLVGRDELIPDRFVVKRQQVLEESFQLIRERGLTLPLSRQQLDDLHAEGALKGRKALSVYFGQGRNYGWLADFNDQLAEYCRIHTPARQDVLEEAVAEEPAIVAASAPLGEAQIDAAQKTATSPLVEFQDGPLSRPFTGDDILFKTYQLMARRGLKNGLPTYLELSTWATAKQLPQLAAITEQFHVGARDDGFGSFFIVLAQRSGVPMSARHLRTFRADYSRSLQTPVTPKTSSYWSMSRELTRSEILDASLGYMAHLGITGRPLSVAEVERGHETGWLPSVDQIRTVYLDTEKFNSWREYQRELSNLANLGNDLSLILDSTSL